MRKNRAADMLVRLLSEEVYPELCPEIYRYIIIIYARESIHMNKESWRPQKASNLRLQTF